MTMTMTTTRNTTRTATGGQSSRDVAQMLNMTRWCLYGSLGTLSHEFDSGGPLDAPSHIPAGSCNSTEWCNGAGHALASQTTIQR
jgi:hypothetical protein